MLKSKFTVLFLFPFDLVLNSFSFFRRSHRIEKGRKRRGTIQSKIMVFIPFHAHFQFDRASDLFFCVLLFIYIYFFRYSSHCGDYAFVLILRECLLKRVLTQKKKETLKILGNGTKLKWLHSVGCFACGFVNFFF